MQKRLEVAALLAAIFVTMLINITQAIIELIHIMKFGNNWVMND